MKRIEYIANAIRNLSSVDDDLKELQQLYLQMRDMYKNESQLKQFMETTKHSLLNNQIPPNLSPVFKNFYSTFAALINQPVHNPQTYNY